MTWGVWTFERESRHITLARHDTVEGPVLAVITDDDHTPRQYGFADVPELIRFQSDMEAFLLKTGWGFLKFAPERRRGRDRRTFPRVNERRRWWTDGTNPPGKVVWGRSPDRLSNSVVS